MAPTRIRASFSSTKSSAMARWPCSVRLSRRPTWRIKPIANDKKMPTISLGAADEQVVPVTPYMWMTAPLSSQVATDLRRLHQEPGQNQTGDADRHQECLRRLGPRRDQKDPRCRRAFSWSTTRSFETSQTNFAPQFAKIADAKPDFLLVWATGAPPVVITKGWADLNNGIPLMMTAAEASTLYAQPAGAAAEGVFVQASMGVIGQSLPASNKFKKLVDDFAGPFQQANNYYPPQFAWDGMLATSFLVDAHHPQRRRPATRSETAWTASTWTRRRATTRSPRRSTPACRTRPT